MTAPAPCRWEAPEKHSCGLWNKLVAEGACLAAEPAFKAAQVFALLGGEDAVVVGHAMGDQMVDDPRQFVRGRRGRLGSTQVRPHAAKVLGQGDWLR